MICCGQSSRMQDRGLQSVKLRWPTFPALLTACQLHDLRKIISVIP